MIGCRSWKRVKPARRNENNTPTATGAGTDLCRDELRKRLQKDVDAGIRPAGVIQRSTARIGLYEELGTEKIDVSHITPEQAAENIIDGDRGETSQ